jgi:anaerobic magnesium-protoporphyrin IX monomethyl ester cyclase
VLRLMNKSFNYDHANWFVNKCNQLIIKTQVCFVIGFPGEKDNDRKLTETYVKSLAKLGADEIAIFIATPLPGSEIYRELTGFKNYSDLTFSPKWRKGYKKLESFRGGLYLKFIWWKFLYNPVKIVAQGLNLFSKNFETKMEMIIYRIVKFNWFLIKSGKAA